MSSAVRDTRWTTLRRIDKEAAGDWGGGHVAEHPL